MKYTGSCHCQQVRFEAEIDLKEALACNCSICGRRGHLLAFTSYDKFKLLTDASAIKDYTFGPKRIHHEFCKNCGIPVFGRGTNPKGDKMVAINIRCLENADWEKVPVKAFDGKNLI